MAVGFTGSRFGITAQQEIVLADLIQRFRDHSLVHHGCCIGGDRTFHWIARPYFNFVLWPSMLLQEYWAKENSLPNDVIKERQEPLARNREIVLATEFLIACPQQATEKIRSGTWATIRYAREAKKSIYLVLPDGTVECE